MIYCSLWYDKFAPHIQWIYFESEDQSKLLPLRLFPYYNWRSTFLHNFKKSNCHAPILNVLCPKSEWNIKRLLPWSNFPAMINFIGLWSSSFFLGNFVGPTVSGICVGKFGFRMTTLGFFVVYIMNTIIDCLELSYNMYVNKNSVKAGYINFWYRINEM